MMFKKNDENNLKKALAKRGPIAVDILVLPDLIHYVAGKIFPVETRLVP